jgi:anti-sigma factor RsiW
MPDDDNPSDDEVAMDAELIRYLDGELSPGGAAALRMQLDASPELAGRLELLRERSARLSNLLSDLNPAPDLVRQSAAALRPRGTEPQRAVAWWSISSAPLRAAAVLALILLGTLAVQPARAWMLERLRNIGETIGIVAEETAPVPVVTPVTLDQRTAVAFPVAGDTFVIESSVAVGAVVVRRTTALGATLRTPPLATTEVVYLANGIRIAGSGGDGATFDLELPSSVSVIRLHHADGSATAHTVPSEGTVRVDLSPP